MKGLQVANFGDFPYNIFDIDRKNTNLSLCEINEEWLPTREKLIQISYSSFKHSLMGSKASFINGIEQKTAIVKVL